MIGVLLSSQEWRFLDFRGALLAFLESPLIAIYVTSTKSSAMLMFQSEGRVLAQSTHADLNIPMAILSQLPATYAFDALSRERVL